MPGRDKRMENHPDPESRRPRAAWALRNCLLKGVALLGFNTPPLGALPTGGAGDVFPRIHKDFPEKSSIPRRSAAGRFIFFHIFSQTFWYGRFVV
jgi:hypothetical protein